MNQLTKYDAARFALAAAVKVDEVKDIRDKAQAMSAYARQAKDTELVEWATEIKVRAERRAGQMLAEMPKNLGAATRSHDVTSSPKTLSELNISKNESSRWQKLAAVTDKQFEHAVAAAKEVAGEVTTAAMLRAAKSNEPSKPATSTATPKPALTVVPAIPPEDVYTPLDAANDQIEELQAMLAVANLGTVAPEDKDQAKNLIAELRAEIKKLTAMNKALTVSRDSFQNKAAELQKQVNRQRREIDRATGLKTA